MGALDYQLGAIDEVTYNTPLTVTRFFEYNENPLAITPMSGRTEGTPLRVGTRVQRSDRFIAYRDHAEGTLDFDVMTKNMGFWFKHALGAFTTTGVGPYTHTFTTGTVDDLYARSFTAQLNYPLWGGTNQALTFSGGKVTSWELGNTVDEMLSLSLGVWFASYTEATALATASYPSAMNNFAWVHGALTVGGTTTRVNSITVSVDNGYSTDDTRRLGNTRVAPLAGPAEVTFSLELDWESLAHYNRVHSATTAGALADITCTWTNGADVLTVNVPQARFDAIDYGSDPGHPKQTVTGRGLFDGTNAAAKITYTTGDATP